MYSALKTVLAASAIVHLLAITSAFASDAMPAEQQNNLVRKYCAVCHTDAARNGGLSLQHFDAAHAAPSLAAMLMSKLTSGLLLETVRAAAFDPGAATLVATKMKSGAMGAAGIPIPDQATINALINALASEATAADKWNVSRTEDPATKAPVLTASILRELPSAKTEGSTAMYRLVLECNAATHNGGMQIAWAPAPRSGTLSVTVDGEAPLTYKVEGTETMGNGSKVTTGPAAVSLYDMRLPAHTLGIKDLFPNESVEFPFGELAPAARQSLAACFKPEVRSRY